MARASIPLDVFNPGHVFACLGFLEAADALLGNAEGGFDWSDPADVRFQLRADGESNPVEVVLDFLANAEISYVAPRGYSEASSDNTAPDLCISDVFPDYRADRMTLPIRLKLANGAVIECGHWADGSSRNRFKLYSGNRSAFEIARKMLRGKFGKPTKKKNPNGAIETEGVAALWGRDPKDIAAQPFETVTLIGGRFNFDARGAWTSLDAGFSPDQQKKSGIVDGVVASPIVEILSVLGLEHARPDEYETRRVRYGVWSGLLPPMLARPILACASVGVAVRRFHFQLDLSGKNKVVTFAQEEARR